MKLTKEWIQEERELWLEIPTERGEQMVALCDLALQALQTPSTEGGGK